MPKKSPKSELISKPHQFAGGFTWVDAEYDDRLISNPDGSFSIREEVDFSSGDKNAIILALIAKEFPDTPSREVLRGWLRNKGFPLNLAAVYLRNLPPEKKRERGRPSSKII